MARQHGVGLLIPFTVMGCFVISTGDKEPDPSNAQECSTCTLEDKCYAQVPGKEPPAHVFACSSYACTDAGRAKTYGTANSYRSVDSKFAIGYGSFAANGFTDTDELDAAFTNAATHWNTLAPDVSIRFESSGCDDWVDWATATEGASVFRGILDNDVQCISMSYDQISNGTGAFASTYCWPNNGDECQHTMQSCDLVFYLKDSSGAARQWVLTPTTTAGQISFQAVLLHELGHALGFGDQSLAGTYADSVMIEAIPEATINSSGYGVPTVTDSDKNAFIWIYGREPGGGSH